MITILELNKVHHGDCLELMKKIPDESVDMILCDLPYGTTANKWDTIIPFEQLWKEYERIIKNNGAIVLTASQPFTSALVMSNPKMFRYEIVYEKTKGSGFQLANKMPLKSHENVLLFYKKLPTYNPQKHRVIEVDEIYENIESNGKKYIKYLFENNLFKNFGKIDRRKTLNSPKQSENFPIASGKIIRKKDDGYRHPTSVQRFNNSNKTKLLHPTQKPVELFEWLIRSYTNEGDVVLDNCIGSGTTAIAAINTNRQWIGIELEEDYVDVANKRISEHVSTS